MNSSRHDPIRKNTFLQSLKDHNWVLYYAQKTERSLCLSYIPRLSQGILEQPPFRSIHVPRPPLVWSLKLTISEDVIAHILICLGEVSDVCHRKTMEEEFLEQTVNLFSSLYRCRCDSGYRRSGSWCEYYFSFINSLEKRSAA